MMLRNTATACLLATTSIFLLAHDAAIVMAQPSFAIPGTANLRGWVDLTTNPLLPTISNNIFHGALAITGSTYTIETKYYNPGCLGSAFTIPTSTPLSVTAVTTSIGAGQFQSTITNTLESLRLFTPNPATSPPQPFFTATPTVAPASAEYKYCIEYLLKNPNGDVIDQERYDVKLTANLNGAVSAGATVITDVDTNPAATTFTAKVIVCNPATGALETKNYFAGDSVGLCFTSNNFPAASISGFNSLGWKLSGTDTPIDIRPGTNGATNGLTVCSSGVQACSVNVPIPGDFALGTAAASRIVDINGILTMRFGPGARRRNVRVLLEDGDVFPRSVGTSLIVMTEEAKTDNTCKCSGLFFIVCWFFKCFLGWFK